MTSWPPLAPLPSRSPLAAADQADPGYAERARHVLIRPPIRSGRGKRKVDLMINLPVCLDPHAAALRANPPT